MLRGKICENLRKSVDKLNGKNGGTGERKNMCKNIHLQHVNPDYDFCDFFDYNDYLIFFYLPLIQHVNPENPEIL
jgi:hypothetical protein